MGLYQYDGLTGVEAEIIAAHNEEEAQMGQSVDPQVMSDLVQAYGNGQSISSLSKTFKMSRHTISGVLKGQGLSIKRGRPTKKGNNEHEES